MERLESEVSINSPCQWVISLLAVLRVSFSLLLSFCLLFSPFSLSSFLSCRYTRQSWSWLRSNAFALWAWGDCSAWILHCRNSCYRWVQPFARRLSLSIIYLPVFHLSVCALSSSIHRSISLCVSLCLFPLGIHPSIYVRLSPWTSLLLSRVYRRQAPLRKDASSKENTSV